MTGAKLNKLPLPLLLLLSSTPLLVHALHEGDNYCDNGQDGFWCNADCSGYYYCAGGERGLDTTCPGTTNWCSSHTMMTEHPLDDASLDDPHDGTKCPSTKSYPACWSTKAPDACAAVSCSGHGECKTYNGKCTCSPGYTGANCATLTTGDAPCPGKIEIMISLDSKCGGARARTHTHNAHASTLHHRQYLIPIVPLRCLVTEVPCLKQYLAPARAPSSASV